MLRVKEQKLLELERYSSSSSSNSASFLPDSQVGHCSSWECLGLVFCGLQTCYNQILPSTGEGFVPGESWWGVVPFTSSCSLPLSLCCLFESSPYAVEWISHRQTIAWAHSLVHRGCTWSVYHSCEGRSRP